MVEDYQNKSANNKNDVSSQLNDSDFDLITTPTQNELNAQQQNVERKNLVIFVDTNSTRSGYKIPKFGRSGHRMLSL